MIKTGVIGHPIAHSKSPLIHNHWIAQYGLEGSYEALDIPPEDLTKRLPELLRDEGYAGFNLTIPHKEIAMDICDVIDDTARAIGAVNTVWIQDNQIHGTNTDAFGFMENLHTTSGIGAALILGAGGAAKAVIYGLLQAGVMDIRIANRTRSKAQALATDPRISVVDWDNREQALIGADLLVNTTALGMDGQPALDIALDNLAEGATVCDIVYAPLMTDLLIRAQRRGNAVITGIGMLLHQARPAFEKWYGVLPDVSPLLIEKLSSSGLTGGSK